MAPACLDGLLVVVVGATASGKSRLAEELAAAAGGEIVSADALQVYRGLDRGTAKPDAAARRAVPHHLLDVLPPSARCTAGEYARLARAALADIAGRGRVGVLAGGSGFYLQAAIWGLDRLPRSDPRWRAVLQRMGAARGVEHLHRMLARLDPARGGRIGAHDRQRIVRALEVVLRTGRPLDRAGQQCTPPLQPVAWVGLEWPRSELHRRIEERLDRMLQAGWLEEVEGLLASGLPPDAHALQAIGYRELVAVVRGELALGEARERIARATRRYAKRQLAWFRRWGQIRWYRMGAADPSTRPEAVRQQIIADVGRLLESAR